MKEINILNVRKSFGSNKVLDGINLEIKGGELFFLLGPSGCGKTTLLRIIAGLISVDSGKIILGGRDITQMPPEKRQTAMVFQNYALWPHMTAQENIQFPMKLKGKDSKYIKEKTLKLLELVHLEVSADRKPGGLSGGQQQRVALARALAAEPDCLLLDEPLSNLDASLRVEMRSHIRRICKETGVTTIYVTHDQKEALAIADRIAVLNEGKVEQVGTPFEIYSKPVTKFVAGFIGEANFFEGKIANCWQERIEIEAGGIYLRAVKPEFSVEHGKKIIACIRPEKIEIIEEQGNLPDRIQGIVEDISFLGGFYEYLIKTALGKFKVTGFGSGGPKKRGDNVFLGVKESDIYVFEKE